MSKPTLLILGGAHYQVPAILEAVKQNFFVVTSGYTPGDPGHRYSHEYHNVDISDTTAVIELARQIKADHVLGYVSETAVRTAAEVNNRLGMPGASPLTVEWMTEKDRFRKFQEDRGFPHPAYAGMTQKEIFTSGLEKLSFPLIVKPVDASGSRGVSRIESEQEFLEAVRYALSYSRLKRIIIEEVIKKKGPQVTGDGFIHDGRVRFLYLGDHHYHPGSIYPVAYSTTWPSLLSEDEQRRIGKETERLLSEIGYRNGPFNMDARIGQDGQVYIIEVAPRNGGNFVPQCNFYSTGVNLEECMFKQILGLEPDFTQTQTGYSANYILHSPHNGIFGGVTISKTLEPAIRQKHLTVRNGERVNAYRNLGDSLGVLLLEFENADRMHEIIKAMHEYVTVDVEGENMRINGVTAG